jgi:hypothetical protein
MGGLTGAFKVVPAGTRRAGRARRARRALRISNLDSGPCDAGLRFESGLPGTLDGG